jgi:hypothetical protein
VILLGLDDAAKDAAIVRYCEEHAVSKVFVLTAERFPLACSVEGAESIAWPDLIEYRFYYRLLQEIDRSTLVVVNECLRTQNRHCLTYNCMRLFLNQTPHRLIFQYLPLIDTIEDLMILVDFDTRSRWKRERFDPRHLAECAIRIDPRTPEFRAITVPTDAKTQAAYAKEKRKLIDHIGLKDPHTIPRNLYLLGGRAKAASVDPARWHVGRNNRLKLPNLQTYRDAGYPNTPYVVFEFPHNFGEFADFLSLSRQTAFDVLATDLKVDQWYFQRYRDWSRRLQDAAAILRQQADRP